MATIWIEGFKGGLDVRRLPEMAPSGSLVRLEDGHINRGAEIEQRAAFVPTYTLPEGQTRSMAYAGTNLVVFGEAAAPALPQGVVYQRLVHPATPTLRLADVLSFEYFGGKVYAIAQFEDGGVYHYYDGVRVVDWNDKRARTRVVITNGLSGSTVDSITVGGVEVLGALVPYVDDPETTAEAVAAQINAYLSDPEYVAAAFAGGVAILANAPGVAANDRAVVVGVTGVSFTGGAPLAGGIDQATTYQSGAYVRTGNQKLFSLTGGEAHFSGLQQPTKWFSDTLQSASGAPGAGFIDMSNEATNAETLTALAKYQNYYAFFSPRTIQIWFNDPDPTLNKQVQVLANTGTLSPRSVVQYGDSDVFYLDESGVRSLRARYGTSAAASADVGVFVDPLVIARLQKMTDAQRAAIISVIEPAGGRYWLAIEDTIFVYSAFEGVGVSAWSTYTLPFKVEDMFVKPNDRKVYVRSGDTIYVYGGQGKAPQYDDTPVVAWLPYLDGGAPTKAKSFQGIDVACRGSWDIRVAQNVDDQDASDVNSRVVGSTFNEPDISGVGDFERMAIRLASTARPADGGPAVLSAIGIRYAGEEPS